MNNSLGVLTLDSYCLIPVLPLSWPVNAMKLPFYPLEYYTKSVLHGNFLSGKKPLRNVCFLTIFLPSHSHLLDFYLSLKFLTASF
jgi:hypothetical protein